MLKAKKPLGAKSQLRAKTSLKATTSLQPKKRLKRGGKGRGPLEKRTKSQLRNVADELFSWYIRFRDSAKLGDQWVGECITCPRALVIRWYDPELGKWRWSAGAENGHLITRGNEFLRFDELNCNLQCSHCNAWLDKDEMITRYRKAVDLKYGDGTYKQLKKQALANENYYLKKPELLKIIAETKESLEYYESY